MPRVWERGQRVLELRPVLDKVTIRRPWSFVVPENTKKNSWLDLFIYFKKKRLGVLFTIFGWHAVPGCRAASRWWWCPTPSSSSAVTPVRSAAPAPVRIETEGRASLVEWWMCACGRMRADVSCTPADAHHVREWKEGKTTVSVSSEALGALGRQLTPKGNGQGW